MKLPSHGALPTWLWAGSELIQLVKESRSHCSDPNRERELLAGERESERERDPNPGTVHWASILTCFKTTCFIRPSAVNKPSWKRAASEQRAYCASLSAHTTADWRSPCLFLFSCTLFYLFEVVFKSFLNILLLNILMTAAQRSVPDTTVSCSSGAGADPDSGFSGSVPASVRCSQLPQFILLFFVFYDALLIPEAGICPCCFSPLPTAPRSLRSYSISTCECWTGPATCCSSAARKWKETIT